MLYCSGRGYFEKGNYGRSTYTTYPPVDPGRKFRQSECRKQERRCRGHSANQAMRNRDVNRIYQTKYTEKDRLNKAKSMSICRLYLKYYGTRYQIKTGKKADFYILASMWCAGPDGYKQIKTNENVQKYIEKIKKAEKAK
jgi:hypothetical protein